MLPSNKIPRPCSLGIRLSKDEKEELDPLVTMPVQLRSPPGYGDGNLILRLTASVNQAWIECFMQIPRDGGLGFTSLCRSHAPDSFTFHGDFATTPIPLGTNVQEVQGAVDCFKAYLCEATDAYRAKLTKDQREKEHEERIEWQRKIAEQKRREEIITNVKI
jgi:hypothetical protein